MRQKAERRRRGDVVITYSRGGAGRGGEEERGERGGGAGRGGVFSRSLLSLCCSGHAAVRRLSRCIPVLRRCFLPAAASLNPGLADRPGPGCERISPAGSTGADRNRHRGGRREGRKEGRKKGASIATNRSHGIIGRCLPLCVCVCEWRCQHSLACFGRMQGG